MCEKSKSVHLQQNIYLIGFMGYIAKHTYKGYQQRKAIKNDKAKQRNSCNKTGKNLFLCPLPLLALHTLRE